MEKIAMNKRLELYKAFIDGLVARKDSVSAQWVRENGFPQIDDNKIKTEKIYLFSVIPSISYNFKF